MLMLLASRRKYGSWYANMPMRRNIECTFFVETPAHNTANSAINFQQQTCPVDQAAFFRFLSIYRCRTQTQLLTSFLFESQTLLPELGKTLKWQNLKSSNTFDNTIPLSLFFPQNHKQLFKNELFHSFESRPVWESDVNSLTAINFWSVDRVAYKVSNERKMQCFIPGWL